VLPFGWPARPFSVVLVEPEIPPNTGNIARLCAATGSPLHLVEPLGFQLTDQAMKRAGLDYWPHVDLHRHASWARYLETAAPPRVWLFSTSGRQSLYDVTYQPGDALVFGSETAGLSQDILAAHPDQVVGIPMQPGKVRSLNLANSVSIALYEALRQQSGSGQRG
jgi:tRNA (cytidine/uridine-2'-O-)-methyltransferase